MTFSDLILSWYAKNKRELPWRSSKDPYKIWLSEIMLQQTRVAQGLPYYLRFVEAFPTVYDMASADEETVLKLWQGLGYYSRARNMHATAKRIVEDFDGQFPDTYEDLVKLKGVGDYTASAIASICFDRPEPVVDGNVFRVLSRYFGIDMPINSSGAPKYFKKLARSVMDATNIRDYNQGLMEFGAIQCAPKKPYCLHCPLNESCVALQTNKVHELPVKLKKTKVKIRHFNYLVVLDGHHNTLLEKRTAKGIWQNLYQFPLWESPAEITNASTPQELPLNLEIDGVSILPYNSKVIVHKLSHQHLHTKFWIVKTETLLKNAVQWSELASYPVPVLIADFIKSFKI